MELHLKITGSLLIALSLMHVVLPSYFKWKAELVPLSLVTRQVLYVHTFFIALTVLLMGILCLTHTSALAHTSLGKALCAGFFGFWLTRLIFQFFVYSPKLWRGKKFETTVHVIFSMLWSYFTVVFLLTYLEEI